VQEKGLQHGHVYGALWRLAKCAVSCSLVQALSLERDQALALMSLDNLLALSSIIHFQRRGLHSTPMGMVLFFNLMSWQSGIAGCLEKLKAAALCRFFPTEIDQCHLPVLFFFPQYACTHSGWWGMIERSGRESQRRMHVDAAFAVISGTDRSETYPLLLPLPIGVITGVHRLMRGGIMREKRMNWQGSERGHRWTSRTPQTVVIWKLFMLHRRR